MSDLISRQAAIDAIQNLNIPEDMCVFEIMSHIEVEIATLPTVQQQRMKGGWITSDDLWETGICSCCGWDSQEPTSYAVTMFKFCPNCGADMRGESDE